jgi:hypothetical protein
LSNPFSELKGNTGPKEPRHEEWGGQFSCQKYPCDGYAKVAKFFPDEHILVWECQDGHRSYIEDVHE